MVADPVSSGFVTSLSRPGGHVTGFATLEGSPGGKWLGLLKEIGPRVARVAMLIDPATAAFAEIYLNPFKAAAASLGQEAIAAPVHDTSELESVVAAQAREPNSGLIVVPDAFTAVHRGAVVALAARYRLPAVYPYRQFTELGGLVSYGFDRLDNFRRAAGYVDRILKGEKPADPPVQAPTKYELTLNLKTAKALGLAIPPMLLARAHRWRRMLVSGVHATITELAAADKIKESCVGRVLPLTLLAPDVAEAILDGRQSPEITLAVLMRPIRHGVDGAAEDINRLLTTFAGLS